MRRTAKPFTIEVKRGGRVRRSANIAHAPDAGDGDAGGGDIRFRDAERMFRNGVVADEPPPPEFTALFGAAPDAAGAPAPERRILPDLIAEAALSEQSEQVAPDAPRRRGRPPKDRTGELPPVPVRRGRPPRAETVLDTLPEAETEDEEGPTTAPLLLDLAASARRRAARDASHLPRGERWKRRLPKACW